MENWKNLVEILRIATFFSYLFYVVRMYMTPIVFAIPSYQRADIIKQKTLATLNYYDIPKTHIYIFCANKREKLAYQYAINNQEYHYVTGVLGIQNQRNFIKKFFAEGQRIVCIDDDISNITEKKSTDKTEGKLPDLDCLKTFVSSAFEELELCNGYLWGVYPVDNDFYMKHEITYDLRFIIGCFYGIINRHDTDLILSHAPKEDVMQTIQHYMKDGVVVRYNWIGVRTNFFGKGGIGNRQSREENAKKASLHFDDKYPGLGSVFVRKDGRHEFRLNFRHRFNFATT